MFFFNCNIFYYEFGREILVWFLCKMKDWFGWKSILSFFYNVRWESNYEGERKIVFMVYVLFSVSELEGYVFDKFILLSVLSIV